jgi:Domain of unknown function (DUF4279)
MRIPTQVRRRLTRLRNRRTRKREAPRVIRSSVPFRYDAALRLGGLGQVQEEVLILTGLHATHAHRAGDPIGTRGSSRKEDLWLLASPLRERASLDEHLQWLWSQIKPQEQQVRALVEQAAWADVCLGCLSESAYPVLSLKPESLEIMRELRLGFAFNFTVV